MRLLGKGILLSAAALFVAAPATAATINVNSYLVNPSFENAGTALNDWHVNPQNGGAFIASDGTAPDGTNYLEFYKDSGSPSASEFTFWQKPSIAAADNLGNSNTYNLTFWVRANGGISGPATTDLSVYWTRDPYTSGGGDPDNMCDGFGTGKLTGFANDTFQNCRFDLNSTTYLTTGWTKYVLSYESGAAFAGNSIGVLFDLTGLDNGSDRIDIDFENPASIDLRSSAVPEPASMMLLGSGLAGIAALARRRRRA